MCHIDSSFTMAVVLFLLFKLLVCLASADDAKRILTNDQDLIYQMQKDLQNLKATVSQLQTTIHSQSTIISRFTNTAPNGVVYTRWGRKECLTNNTELVYTGIAGGGHYTEKGRSATPVCVPHDPDIGPAKGSQYFATVYGMEYEVSAFGANLVDKDVPCAVCRAFQVSSMVMIPGKKSCYKGWTEEYKGILVAGYYAHDTPSSYLCVDEHPDMLEAGVGNDNGYLIYPAIAKCGSLKCPPYVQDRQFTCVVCTK